MALSPYLAKLRAHVGTDLLIVPGVSAILRDGEGRILVQKRTDDGRWGLPGGAVDPGETPAEAVVREVWEELHVRVRPTALLGVYGGDTFRHLYPHGDIVEYVVSVFACELLPGEHPAPYTDETDEVAFFFPEELPELTLPYPSSLFSLHPSQPAHFEWNPTRAEAPVPTV